MADYSDLPFNSGDIDYPVQGTTLRDRSQGVSTEVENARNGETLLTTTTSALKVEIEAAREGEASLLANLQNNYMGSGAIGAPLDFGNFKGINSGAATVHWDAVDLTTLNAIEAAGLGGIDKTDIAITGLGDGTATTGQRYVLEGSASLLSNGDFSGGSTGWAVVDLSVSSGEVIPVPVSPLIEAVSRASPLSHWKGDETSGTILTDYTGAHNGTYSVDASGMTSEKLLNSEGSSIANFSGANVVQIPHHSDFNFQGDWTVAVSFYYNDHAADDTIIGKWHSTNTAEQSWRIKLNSLGGVGIEVYNGTSKVFRASTFYTQPETQYTVHATSSGGTYRIYVNGIQGTGETTLIPQIITSDVTIGDTVDVGNSTFDGVVDEVVVYERALDLSEIKEHINSLSNQHTILNCEGTNGSSVFTDEYENNYYVKEGTPTIDTSKFKFGSSSLSFGGSDRIFGCHRGLSTIHTVDFWFNATALSGYLLRWWGTFGGAFAMTNLFLNGGSVVFRQNDWDAVRITSSTISTDTWYHIALCYTPTLGTSMFLDGIYQGSYKNGGSVETQYLNSPILGVDFTGNIDAFRVLNNIALYPSTTNFTPPTVAPVKENLWYSAAMDDAPIYWLRGDAADTGIDSSLNDYNFTENGTMNSVSRTGFPSGTAIQLDGSTYLRLNDGSSGEDAAILQGNMTFEIWVEFDSLPSSGNTVNLGTTGFNGSGETANYQWEYSIVNNGGSYELTTFHETGPLGGGQAQSTTLVWNTPATGTIYHIAVTRNSVSKYHTWYVNGVLIGDSNTYTTNPTGGTTGSVAIFSNEAGGNYITGYASDVALYGTLLSHSTIIEKYSAGIA